MPLNRNALAAGLTIALAGSAVADTMLFDFGRDDKQTALLGWNNVTYTAPDPVAPLNTVVDSTGATVAGVSLQVTNQFFHVGTSTEAGSESPSGDAAGYPVTATDDALFGHTGSFAGTSSNPSGVFKLTGLNQATTYSFTFFSARTGVSDNRETAYTVDGANSDSGLLQASNNESNVLTLAGITPDINGEIYVTVEAGPNNDNVNKFFYINLMQVNWDVPEPTSLALLGLGTLLVAGRRRG